MIFFAIKISQLNLLSSFCSMWFSEFTNYYENSSWTPFPNSALQHVGGPCNKLTRHPGIPRITTSAMDRESLGISEPGACQSFSFCYWLWFKKWAHSPKLVDSVQLDSLQAVPFCFMEVGGMKILSSWVFSESMSCIQINI